MILSRGQIASLGAKFLPFADAASAELPLSRLLRLSLFQVTVGMSMVLLAGTLNRVMIVELGVSAWLVALMVALPIVFAPLRALIGHRSDTHRSILGWRRVPYLWIGTMLQFGGFAIMPFALILLSGDQTVGPDWAGTAGAALAFLLVGAGVHTVQTTGLALATDIAPEDTRPRVVALLYVMLLLGMVGSALVFSYLLRDFSQLRLIQTVQGAAAVTLLLNLVALWKQEPRRPDLTRADIPRESFGTAWACFAQDARAMRVLLAVALGTAAFAMQDILLEPYGATVLGMTVGETTQLTALLAGGTLAGFALAAGRLAKGADPCRLAAYGVLAGIPAFSAVIMAEPMGSTSLFQVGTVLIGFGAGLFAVGMLTAAMALATRGAGLALGAWGAAQATAAGAGVALGGVMADTIGALSDQGLLGAALQGRPTGYIFVYHTEILLLFITLAVIGPLAVFARVTDDQKPGAFGIAEFPS